MKTSPGTWKASLNRWLTQRGTEPGDRPRLAIVGVGNVERSDDAAGSLVARALLRLSTNSDKVLILDAGHAPENVTAVLRRFAPQLVLFIDAADLGETPGAVRWIDTNEISGMSASTHSLPLSMLAEYLRLEHGCEVAVLGIQPASNDTGELVSAAVQSSVEELRAGLTAALEV